MKQYLLLCDETTVAQFKSIFRPEALQFLEVQGMNVAAGNQYNVLVTPVIPPVNPAPAPEPVPAPTPDPVVDAPVA